MLKSKRLAIVEELAQKSEDECARALGVAVTQLQQAQDTLADLQGYIEEYKARKTQIAEASAGGAALQNYVSFMGSLEQAIAEQQSQVDRLQMQLDAVKAEWAKRHEKRKNIAKLIDRYRRQEDTEAEKKLQKELDDLILLKNNQSTDIG